MSNQSSPAVPSSLQNIRHIVVLMLENRSFDHLFGYLKAADPRVEGLSGTESNPKDPATPGSPEITVSRATVFAMPFDPAHEFPDVQNQLYAPSGAPADPAAMKGFLANAASAVKNSGGDPSLVLQGFQSDQLPVLTALARQFALFNYYHSSLPGPTWPNRFFVHAATSGGLTASPPTGQIVNGFSFKNGTIYDALTKAGKNWRIYHDGLPQSVGISSLRGAYVDPFTKNYRDMSFFQQDVAANNLPEYTFIEPNYDTGNNYKNGNSMHPLNDIREGEKLVKLVYETLRQSNFWVATLLIVTFDEHGGFYDHVPPPSTVATGDDDTYKTNVFTFERLGVRVPCIVASPYTQAGMIIGSPPGDPSTVFDHGSVLATVEKCFQLAPLTQRDAQANTLEAALNPANPRTTDAPSTLPNPAPDPLMRALAAPSPLASATAPLSDNQKALLDLALACDLQISPRSEHDALIQRHQAIVQQQQAAQYMSEVENKIQSRRHKTL